MSVAGHAAGARAVAPANGRTGLIAISVIFFLSGFAALIYQVTWQRALFSIFGINVEATTVVVAGFLLGLGLGSFVGGRLSRSRAIHLLALFGLIEISIGLFGVMSLRIFQWVGVQTLGWPAAGTAAASIGLLLVPTALMGATLPILGQYLVQRAGNVGQSIGLLYYVNTLGSAAACFVSALWLMNAVGMQGAVNVAAAINILVGTSALHQAYLRRTEGRSTSTHDKGVAARISGSDALGIMPVLMLAALTGYVSLSFEILWFRSFMIITNAAPAFAILLGTFLAGLALGSSEARRFCDAGTPGPRLVMILSACILGSSVLGFLVLPATALSALSGADVAVPTTLVALVLLQTLAAGAIFPLLCHLSVPPDARAGAGASWVYLANIFGSVSGTLMTGFILMDVLSTRWISVMLAILGAAATASLAGIAPMPRRTRNGLLSAVAATMVSAPLASGALFTDYYERIIYRAGYGTASKFVEVVENRSGVITVNAEHLVFGGGKYDGAISVDLVNDPNFLIRPASLALFHPKPRNVLMIGLATGAWAQIIANHPDVETLTIVEINPGYLSLIQKYPQVAGILTNPKVKIVVDDGRRWIKQHAASRFDAIVQNTTFHYRPNITNLLSIEYFALVRNLLNPDGVFIYNTTGSMRAQRTGCLAFADGVRELNAMVVGKSALRLDDDRLRKVLADYRIDGRRLFDLSNQHHRDRLAEIVAKLTLPPAEDGPAAASMETCASILDRTPHLAPLTDNNMGEEWQQL